MPVWLRPTFAVCSSKFAMRWRRLVERTGSLKINGIIPVAEAVAVVFWNQVPYSRKPG